MRSIKTDIIDYYVGGSFENNYLKTNTELKYGYTNFGIAPGFDAKKKTGP
jgi:hypothetical protein